jgi:cell division septum initiation protein DivIVA
MDTEQALHQVRQENLLLKKRINEREEQLKRFVQ